MELNIYYLIAIIGLISISVGVIWGSIKKGKSYPFLIIGGICLEIYSIHIKDTIFIILQAIFILSAIFGLFRIKKQK